MTFEQKMVIIFFTALGVVLGAALIGSASSIMVRQPPVTTMVRIAGEIKIWAIVAAIGGTFTAIEVLESGIFDGEFRAVIKQLLYVLSGFAGAQVGYFLILYLAGGNN
ncbi:YtrH family sporulation protein [Desulfofalx alkaliphila]|uniref:YtrH family sporulation protein n=1 Tax=Desulfofalx alkaliphila TaxID=105483 RepID=UPI0004E265A4|nr:YtrH family sporulation protein [Desulfofalx alkaliphila]